MTIWTTSHAFSRTDIPINQQGNTSIKPVIIGNGVWVGQKVTIKSGVQIGAHSIIGAGSVVTKSVKAWAIVGGVPAQLIRMRK